MTSASSAQGKGGADSGKYLPNVGDLIFVGVCQLLLFMRPTFIFSDGSTGWHLATGMKILHDGIIPHADFLSYTFAGKDWVAYEWFSDLLMAALVQMGGLNLLAVTVTISLAALTLALYQRMRDAGSNFILAMTFSIVGLLTAAVHWLVRPHIFTFWGVYLFATRLESFYSGKRSFKWLAAWLLPYMVLWVNCHPAFLLAFAITGLYLLVIVVRALTMQDKKLRQIKRQQIIQLALLLLLLAMVSVINPYGLQLYHYISEYLHGTSILAQTDEFKPPNFLLSFHADCLALLLACLAGGLAIGRKNLSLPALALTLVFAYLSLQAVRHMPLFVIVALPTLGALYSGVKLLPKSGGLFKSFATGAAGFEQEEKKSKLHLLPIIYSAVVLAFALLNHSGAKLLEAGFDEKLMPSKTLDYIATNKLPIQGGFNLDNWGGLISYKLGMPVFIDDRADFYGEKFYSEYGTICEMRPGWNQLLEVHKIKWILFPKDSTLINELKTRKDWSIACEDEASTLMVRVNKN